MNVRKARDRFDTKPRLNAHGQPVRALLTGRQPEILKALSQHGTLNVYDLHGIVGGNLHTLRWTMRVLKDRPNEYIRIVPEQVRTHSLILPLYYQLTPKGVEWLNQNGGHAQQPRRVYNIGHTSLVSHITSSISAGITASRNATFVSWEEMQTHPKFPKDTITAKDNTAIASSKGHIRPDTHPFGIILQNGEKQSYRFFVIEADNGTETIKPSKPAEYTGNSIYAKFEAYLDFIESKGFHARYGLPNYFVLFVFTSRARLDNAKILLSSMARSGCRYILFQLADHDSPAGYIFSSPCERVGFSPLQLNQP